MLVKCERYSADFDGLSIVLRVRNSHRLGSSMLFSVSVRSRYILDQNYQSMLPVKVPLISETRIGLIQLFAHKETVILQLKSI